MMSSNGMSSILLLYKASKDNIHIIYGNSYAHYGMVTSYTRIEATEIKS